LQVLKLIWEGLGTKEIALKLGKSPSRVKACREHIALKLGTTNAVQAVRAALAQNILKVI
jgi:DNA-binding NarL/FixJ family response regulator